jgi:hypothetical protein
MQDNYEGDFYKMLLSIFDPKAANIKVVKAGQSLREGVEVWTTGESLLIRYSIFEREKDSIREALK